MSHEFVAQLLGMVGVAVGVYAGIRADIASMRARIEIMKEDLQRAHDRIDLINRIK